MKKINSVVILAAVFMLVAANALGVQVRGTAVSLTPPKGFVVARRFAGFMNRDTAASIMVSEIPGPFDETTSGFDDKQRLQNKGMTLIYKTSVKVDGHKGILLHLKQSAYGTEFEKWVVALDRNDATTIITASYPASLPKQGELLKHAILAAKISNKATSPEDGLEFTMTPVAPFKVAKVLGQFMVLSPGGTFPVKDEKVPFMLAGISASVDLDIKDKKGFSERRIKKISTVNDISIASSKPVKIHGLSGYETIATGKGGDMTTPFTIFQVVLFDPSGYSLIQGITPTTKKKTYLPIFEKIANSFRMRN